MNSSFITYQFYSSDFGGALIPSDSFNKYAIMASSKVEYFTFQRASDSELSEEIIRKRNFATCEIAELLYSQDLLKRTLDTDNSTVASETVGPHSKTYVNKSNLQAQRILNKQDLDNECYFVCLNYLSTTNLMYRGF